MAEASDEGSGDPTATRPGGGHDGVSERFRAAARAVTGPGSGPPESLPSCLAEIAQTVLSADGAGLSVFSDDFRVPIGCSDPDSAVAEALQFTVEQGPCWDAVRHDLPAAADADAIARRWPQFADELARRTPFRSVASVPLRLARGAGGALDLYFHDPSAAGRSDSGDATAVVAHIADILNRTLDDDDADLPDAERVPGPRWLRSGAARGRHAVWIASGMLVGDGVRTPEDGLSVLRARAYSEGHTVDELAADLVARRRTPDQLRGVEPTGG